MGVFITGTDTNIGKTLISSWICLHTGASYWKPFQTGASDPGSADRDTVARLTPTTIYPEAYRFRNPLSPQAAAAAEGIFIDAQNIALPPENRLVIEGAGGVLVPLNATTLLIDLIQSWAIPVIVVSRSTLGTINHTCLTLEALSRRHIPVLGVIMNGPFNSGNRQAIENFGGTPVLAEFPLLNSISSKALETIPFSQNLHASLSSCLGGSL